jgi:class 3 adenylate cyclase
MANLDQIYNLNKRYNRTTAVTEAFTANLNEGFNPNSIEKAITNRIAEMGPRFSRCFEFSLPTDIAILFIDVCNFSTRFKHLKGESIADYFDQYYNLVIPIIYRFGGEIDKIIGDGIIAVFGQPFLNEDYLTAIRYADACAKAIIEQTINTGFSSKVAFHAGSINYFKNKSGLYNEFTIIGKPLTELFRLESISINECVNYYDNSPVKIYYESRNVYLQSNSPITSIKWWHSHHDIINLKGVDYKNFYSIKLS